MTTLAVIFTIRLQTDLKISNQREFFKFKCSACCEGLFMNKDNWHGTFPLSYFRETVKRLWSQSAAFGRGDINLTLKSVE